MRTTHKLKISISILTMLITSILAPADENSKHSLEDWKIGAHITGAEFSDKDLKGKVVVIEYWGTR